LNSVLVKCLRQEAGNNLCGYYVCEFIRQTTKEKGADRNFKKIEVR
jgi:hypothetical protein